MKNYTRLTEMKRLFILYHNYVMLATMLFISIISHQVSECMHNEEQNSTLPNTADIEHENRLQALRDITNKFHKERNPEIREEMRRFLNDKLRSLNITDRFLVENTNDVGTKYIDVPEVDIEDSVGNRVLLFIGLTLFIYIAVTYALEGTPSNPMPIIKTIAQSVAYTMRQIPTDQLIHISEELLEHFPKK